jgi:hypothetical protein
MACLSLPLVFILIDYHFPGTARPTELVEAQPGRVEYFSGRVVRLTREGETAVLVLEDRQGFATCTFAGPDPRLAALRPGGRAGVEGRYAAGALRAPRLEDCQMLSVPADFEPPKTPSP